MSITAAMRCARVLVSVSLATFACVAPATGGDVPRVAGVADQATISRLIVRFRPDAQPAPGETLGDPVLAQLQAALGHGLSAGTPTRGGDQVLVLADPVDVTEARRLLGVLRMRSDVLRAELDRSPSSRASAASATSGRGEGPAVVRRFIVTFSDPAAGEMARGNARPNAEWNALLSAGAGVPMRVVRPTVGGAWIVEMSSAVSRARATAIAAALAATPGVRSASPDKPVKSHAYFPNDPYFQDGHQRNMADPLSTSYYGIDAPAAWDITVGSDLVVAVVDTGVRPHGEFYERLLDGYSFISDPDNSHDGLGRNPSGIDPGNWHTEDDCSDGTAEDSDWHGTHVTGIIAAGADNGEGIAGINWYATILPVRVLGTCGGNDSDILEGMSWAAGLPVPGVPDNPNPAKVINMSLGGEGECDDHYQGTVDAILARGTFIAVSAGNDSADIEGQSPANCYGVSTVAATDPYGFLASYSNYSVSVDIAAPGGDQTRYGHLYGIWSTLNTGTTDPEFSTYDAYQGTSQAAPHVSGVASLMLAVNPALSPAQIKSIMADTSSYFAPTSQCRSTGACGAGIVNAYYAVKEAQRLARSSANYQGLWYRAPAGSEGGWGINLAHQGDAIFATWFTYDVAGRAWWLTMTANKIAEGVYGGQIVRTNGAPFSAYVPPATVTVVGSGTLSFSSATTGTFSYTVNDGANAATQTKAIVLQTFGPVPTCVWGAQPNLALATNYQDLWWAAGGGEGGWGVSLTHQGTTIFATWFTYDANRNPLWLSATLPQTGSNTFSGALLRTGGQAFNAVPFDPNKITRTQVGSAALVFSNGNAATFTYNVDLGDGVNTAAQSKAITRQVFRTPGTVCQ